MCITDYNRHLCGGNLHMYACPWQSNCELGDCNHHLCVADGFTSVQAKGATTSSGQMHSSMYPSNSSSNGAPLNSSSSSMLVLSMPSRVCPVMLRPQLAPPALHNRALQAMHNSKALLLALLVVA